MKQSPKLEWQIRSANTTDAAAIQSFLGAQRRPARADFVAAEYFLAESLGQIVGCVAARASAQVGYLYGLAVAKMWRRSGMGHQLTQHGLESLWAQGVSDVFALVMFWNIKFVKKHGFELVDKRKKIQLRNLHPDFLDGWAARSSLMVSRRPSCSRS